MLLFLSQKTQNDDQQENAGNVITLSQTDVSGFVIHITSEMQANCNYLFSKEFKVGPILFSSNFVNALYIE